MGEIGNVGPCSPTTIRQHCAYKIPRLGGENGFEERGKQIGVSFDFVRDVMKGKDSVVAHILSTEHDPNGINKTQGKVNVLE